MTITRDILDYLPDDGCAGQLLGRAWLPAALTGSVAGPSPVLISDQGVSDLAPVCPTTSQLLNGDYSLVGLWNWRINA